MIVLRSDRLRIEIDPDRGADILSIRTLPDSAELLLHTPWRDRANALAQGRGVPGVDGSEGRWLERYRGGWQTLIPVAGPSREVDGASVGFHGEASRAAWEVLQTAPDSARLALDLFSLPLRIERTIEVDAGALRIHDTLINLGSTELAFDYVSHPAFGGALLEGEVTLAVGARHLTLGEDGRAPVAGPRDVGSSTSRATLGTLSGFDRGWARISNDALRLDVTLQWDAHVLPFAWLWEELQGSAGFPWFGRVRTVAIEPASRPAAADGPAMRLGAGEHVVIVIEVEVESRLAR